jgi:hypothetical protein
MIGEAYYRDCEDVLHGLKKPIAGIANCNAGIVKAYYRDWEPVLQ